MIPVDLAPMATPDSVLALAPEWEAMIEAMEDGVCVQSPDSRLLRVNRAFAEMLGLPAEHIVGQPCSEIFGCAQEAGTLPQFCARLASRASGHTESEEVSGRRPGQRLRARVSPVRDGSGGVVAYVMVVRDVTDVVARERQLARAEQLSLIGELAAGLAHEIKNPLAGIQGAVDILIQRRDPSDPERAVLEGVRREVGRIDATVHALLDRATPRALKLHPTSLDEVVQRAVLLAQHQAASAMTARGSRISLNFQPASEPVLASVDAALVEDAVLNLILNAIAAIDGDGTITVRLRRQQAERKARPEAWIQVEDTGHGIPAEDLTRVFTPFYTTTPGGTGLGLPAVRRIARAHGGRVEVTSEMGKGSSFTLRLPLDTPGH